MLDLIWLGAIAGVIPVYLGILAALFLGKVLPRTWEGGLIGVATGVLVYLFFDLMHEATEQTGARDPVSWLVFFGQSGTEFCRAGRVGSQPGVRWSLRKSRPVSALYDCRGDGAARIPR